jgi:hypothetical protein
VCGFDSPLSASATATVAAEEEGSNFFGCFPFAMDGALIILFLHGGENFVSSRR